MQVYKKSPFYNVPFDFSLVAEVDSYNEMLFNYGQVHTVEYMFKDYPDLYLLHFTNLDTFLLTTHGVQTFIDNEFGLQAAVRHYIEYQTEKNGG